MKTLSNYIADAQTTLFKKHGAFFAFSTEQFTEQKQPDVVYANGPHGMIVPKDNLNALNIEHKQIIEQGIAADIAENGLDAIINRELANHECYYTGEIEDAADSLLAYGVTYDQVHTIYLNNKNTCLACEG